MSVEKMELATVSGSFEKLDETVTQDAFIPRICRL